MKYIVPSPEVKLYEDGFDDHDLLGRKLSGQQLSDLVERIEDPLVIAIDGTWGSGKSFFLKCWVGAHTKENKKKGQTIYFDAFENDYLDDPLIGLTSCISQRLEQSQPKKRIWDKAKKAAPEIVKPLVRIGLGAVTSGASEIVGTAAGAILASSKEEITKQVDTFWQKENDRKAAMYEFRNALIELTQPNKGEDFPTKLVITIDELDRCRPDYALSVLEVIKHFFNVPHVHFVLGVNLRELENSVRARYGNNTNARLYLQKFISLTMSLPENTESQTGTSSISLRYFDKMSRKMDINKNMQAMVREHIERNTVQQKLSLRIIERILTEMALVPQSPYSFTNLFRGVQYLISGLIVLKVVFPNEYLLALEDTLSINDIHKTFGIGIDAKPDKYGEVIDEVWKMVLWPKSADLSESRWALFGGLGRPPTLRVVIEDYLEKFNFDVPEQPT
ncbi:KAP family P-loop NTPase fold protein [Rhodovibrionaceae bacterium A322]